MEPWLQLILGLTALTIAGGLVSSAATALGLPRPLIGLLEAILRR
jgi:hypothetical protein